MAAVPKASVIITNHPTHYSIRACNMNRGMFGADLRRQGCRPHIGLQDSGKSPKEHDIPAGRECAAGAPARSIATVEIDEGDFRSSTYQAVAEIIGYVMGLKRNLVGTAGIRKPNMAQNARKNAK